MFLLTIESKKFWVWGWGSVGKAGLVYVNTNQVFGWQILAIPAHGGGVRKIKCSEFKIILLKKQNKIKNKQQECLVLYRIESIVLIIV